METFKDIHIKYCDHELFYKIVTNLYNQGGITLTDNQISGDESIFAIGGIIEIMGVEIPIIYGNKELLNITKNEWVEAILTHEVAHCNGIFDEEEADRWALENCSKEAQEVLIFLWDERHGHEYKG